MSIYAHHMNKKTGMRLVHGVSEIVQTRVRVCVRSGWFVQTGGVGVWTRERGGQLGGVRSFHGASRVNEKVPRGFGGFFGESGKESEKNVKESEKSAKESDQTFKDKEKNAKESESTSKGSDNKSRDDGFRRSKRDDDENPFS